MKTMQAPNTEVQSIDTAQLGEVVGGCNCGCGMANCNCANGSCGGGSAASRFRFPGFNFFRR